MRCFAGITANGARSQPDGIGSTQPLPRPVCGRSVWDGPESLWLIGTWSERNVIVLSTTVGRSSASVRVAILGSCLATRKELLSALHRADAVKNYDELTRFPGSYSVILATDGYVRISADPTGLKPVFYAVTKDYTVYSSSSLTVAQAVRSTVDRSWLAARLILPGVPGLIAHESPFVGVQAVPHGQWLELTSGKATLRPYWKTPEPTLSARETATRLREEIVNAIEGRLDLATGQVTSDVSGGLDSTSLSLLAAERLARQGRKLVTLTGVGTPDPRNEDFAHARAAIGYYDNIRPIIIGEDDLASVYADLDQGPLTDEPTSAACAFKRLRQRFALLQREGCEMHMCGEGGDAVLQGPPSYLADLVQCRRIATLRRHARGWAASLRTTSPAKLVLQAVRLSRLGYADWLAEQADRLEAQDMSINRSIDKRRESLDWGWQSASREEWFPVEARGLVGERLRLYSLAAAPYSQRPGQHQQVAAVVDAGRSTRMLEQVADAFPLTLESPYLDPSVVEVCLSARTEERTDPYRPKPLLVQALGGDLPTSVLARRNKGYYSRTSFRAIEANAAGIQRLFDRSMLADLGLLDVDSFRTTVANCAAGRSMERRAFSETIAAEMWLPRVTESLRRRQAWSADAEFCDPVSQT